MDQTRFRRRRVAALLSILLAQFKNPLIYIITAAAFISLALSEFGDAAIVFVVIAVDCVVAFSRNTRQKRL